ncbi:MAG: M10 family metallopeptidase, partial [Paracoccaceae bacterium]
MELAKDAISGAGRADGQGFAGILNGTTTLGGAERETVFSPTRWPIDATVAAAAPEAAIVSSDPLSAIDWGSRVPATVIDVYFAPAGTYIDGVTDLGPSQGFTAFEKRMVFSALEQIENVTNLDFRETTSPSVAEFRLGTFDLPEGVVSFMEPPGGAYSGFMGIDPYYFRAYDIDSGNPLLSRGGYVYAFILHELGHGLGLAHPHDEGGSSTILQGVDAPWHSYGVGDLNQGVFTMMSWNHGWPGGPYGDEYYDGTYLYVNDFGYEATPMALDIAVLQRKYGANLGHATGDTVYRLPATNGFGTFFESIWDAGGTDTIRYDGHADAIIDLRPATLQGEVGGSGFVSYAAGIRGGFTIAAGTVIENATGAAGDDTLTGNGAANLLQGRLGNDTIDGGAGNDTLRGGAAFDSLLGGGGADLVFGDDGRDTAYLGAGNDLYRDNAQGGDLGRDTVFGGVGDDTVQGGNGA